MAAGAPVALVVLCTIPSDRPGDLFGRLLSLAAAALLTLAAARAGSLRPARADLGDQAGPQPGPVPPPRPRWDNPNCRPDPAMVSVDRWLAHWPGVAGVSAVSWWSARVGTAGLLTAFGLRAVGAPSPAALAAMLVAALALISLTPGSRPVVHAALGVVTVTGLFAVASGFVALGRGRLTAPLLPSGPLMPTAGAGGVVAVGAATTVALVCLVAACVPALSPGPAGTQRKGTSRLVRGCAATALACWALAVPVLLRVGGFSLARVVKQGGPAALSSSLAVVLRPLAGSRATTMAGWLLMAACLAGALGTMAGGTGLAERAIAAARSGRSGRHRPSWPASAPGAPTRQSPERTTPPLTLAGIATASGLAASGVALLSPRAWLVIALGGLATGALALTTLAPPALRRCQQVPGAVRVWVAATWALVVTVAIGSAGPGALAVVGIASLSGAFALGWRGEHLRTGWRTRTRHLAIPWGTAATALVTTSAVTTLEVLSLGNAPSSSGLWRGLAVVVMGAGVVVLAVFPATSRLRVEHLGHTAATLAEKVLPALVNSLEALASGGPGTMPTAELSELKAAARPLETELGTFRASDEMLALTRALVDATKHVQRLALAVEAVGRLDSRRLEDLVEERTVALSNVNRHLVDSQWLRRQLLDRTVRVAEDERARLAANLHDGPIQRLATLGLILDRCTLRMDRNDKAGAYELVKRARNDLGGEIHSLRQMMTELRPPILDEGGLEAAIRDQVSAWSTATGIAASFESSSYPSLSPDAETVIYRVIQESLANVAKHARADYTSVTLAPSGNGVKAVVRDNGRGFASQSQPDLLRNGHFGLVVMRERVELAAGRFEVQSAPRHGTEVVIWLPTTSAREPVGAA